MRPPAPVARTAPFDLKDSAIVAEGGRLFQQNCTGYCHGREGRISRAPKLRGRQFEPLYLFDRISHGFPPMPAYKTVFPPEQIWRLVAYIMSLADKED
jgi:mono/diheme cytochrome c family protein